MPPPVYMLRPEGLPEGDGTRSVPATAVQHQVNRQPIWRWRIRFGLRTLLFVLTVFGIWLARETNIVRQRKAAIAEMARLGGGPVWVENLTAAQAAQWTTPEIPFWRRWLGDKPVVQLILPYEYTDDAETSERIVALFPETVLTEVWWTRSHAPGMPGEHDE